MTDIKDLSSRMPKPEQHAPPETLLGQLQRGRGAGYLRAISSSANDLSELLIDCITNDPRLDSQVESRADYYASLALKLNIDISGIAAYVQEYDDKAESNWNTPLAVETLGEMAKRGRADAAEFLCDYIRTGRWWDYDPINALAQIPDEQIHRAVAKAIEDRFPSDDELQEALNWLYLDDETWLIYVRHSSRIAKFSFNERKRASLERAKQEEGFRTRLALLSLENLLAETSQLNYVHVRKIVRDRVTPADITLLLSKVSIGNPFVSSVAFSGLAKLAPVSLLPWLLEFWAANPQLPAPILGRVIELFEALPPTLTLPLARARLFHESCHEQHLAQNILALHATNEDIPLLRSALADALTDDEEHCYRICNLAEALGRTNPGCEIPELTETFLTFRYSYGRRIAAETIYSTTPTLFAEKFAFESLWDCGSGTRALAAAHIPLPNPAAELRLSQLRTDKLEDEKVREASAQRFST